MGVGRRSSERALRKVLGQLRDELRPISLGAKNLTTGGTEQNLLEQPGGAVSQISGYIDLANLAPDDTVVIKFYAKVKADDDWRACYQEAYSGVQALPLLHIPKRPENHGLKITIQQTAGTYKAINYEFFEES